MPIDLDISKILQIGTELVTQAGKLTLPYFMQYTHPLTQSNNGIPQEKKAIVDYKKDNSPVTEADRNTELWLRTALKTQFPNFGILGEEFGDDTQGTEYSWIIDPIDGTKSFITGVPLYTTLLGLVKTDTREPLAGFIYAPVTNEIMSAATGLGSYYNGIKVQVDPCKDISNATMLSYDWQKAYQKSNVEYSNGLFDLTNRAKMVRTWSDGYAYMLLASGKVHSIVDPSMHIWDLAPVYTIVIEAGASIGTWNRTPIHWKSNDIDCIVTSSPTLLEYIQKNL